MELSFLNYFAFKQVKLIKCLVENIVVDISFNQLGGLCTLCFLEEVSPITGITFFKTNSSENPVIYLTKFALFSYIG